MRALWAKWRWPVLAAVLVLATLTARVILEQRAAWSRAVALEKTAKIDDAIDEYRWVLRWYVPFGLTSEAGEALRDIATKASADQPERAMRALDALRSGLIASRNLWQPRADLVDYASRTLPPLLVRVADRHGDKRDPKLLLARFQADYARPVGVAPWTSAAVSLGFILWLGALVQVVRRGVTDEGRWQPAGWRWLGASLAGFAVWLSAMWLG